MQISKNILSSLRHLSCEASIQWRGFQCYWAMIIWFSNVLTNILLCPFVKVHNFLTDTASKWADMPKETNFYHTPPKCMEMFEALQSNKSKVIWKKYKDITERIKDPYGSSRDNFFKY